MKLPAIDPFPSHDSSLCVSPIGDYALCQTLVRPADVTAAIERQLRRNVMGICTYADGGFGEWGKAITEQTRLYAARHSYDFIHPDKPIPTGDSRPPHWQKAEILARELIHYDFLAYLDGDALIVKPEFDLLSFIKSLPPADCYINRDANGLCNGVMVWRNTLAAHRFIRRWRDSWHKGFCDQVAMVKLLAGERDVVVREVPQRKLNAFMWGESDWLCHFGGPKRGDACHIRAFIDEYTDANPPPLLPKGGKRAAIVMGHESSGTKLWTETLIACGTYGDASDEQRLDLSFADATDFIVWRRSFPHAEEWPDVAKMLECLREHGFTEIFVYWTMRERQYAVQSMIRAGHAQTEGEARRDIEEGLRRIGHAVRDLALPCRIVRYERLIAEPGYRVGLLSHFGLEPVTELPEIYRGNDKYLTKTISAQTE